MASPDAPTMRSIELAEASFRRSAGEGFFQAFYHRLLALDAETRAKFAHTDFERQNKLLQHGIGLLFTYAKRGTPILLERIAARHAPSDLGISADHFPLFVECLIQTVRECDPEATDETEAAWRVALGPGIAFMTERVHPSGTDAGA